MENQRKIDRSFKDRQRVLQLLDKLKKENITYAEMDEIGSQLKKAGRSAIQPLLRKLWHEKSGILISKYTYLLDFLDDSYWFDQIVQIALKRRDLETEGRSAIMATLEDCGIDVTAPPFSTIFAGNAVPVADLFPRMMANGEEGILIFLEDFACMTAEAKRSFLLDLAGIPDKRVLQPLQLLLWHDDVEVVKMTIDAIGRVRFAEAAALLKDFQIHADSSLQQLISRSIRRLSFVGVKSEEPPPGITLKPFYSAFAGPVDGNGYRHIWFARWRADGRLDSVDLQLHDSKGVNSVWGVAGETQEQYDVRAAERLEQELIEPVAPEYALLLLKDALFRNRREEYPLPPEFYLRRSLFAPAEIIPALYEPKPFNWSVKPTPALLASSAKLFDDEFFAGWSLESHRVYEIAEEWIAIEKQHAGKGLAEALEQLIEILCKEEFQPRLEAIARRLIINADYLARTGADGEVVKTALVAAESIKQFSMPCHLHPFVRRFAMESMIVAREAMEEGYDLRDFEEDDWE
jgi:hypothetical protein